MTDTTDTTSRPAMSSSPSAATTPLDPPAHEQARPRGWTGFVDVMKRSTALALPYFQSEQRWQARGLLLVIVALNLGAVYMLVLINDWNRLFYDALQEKNQPVFWEQLLRFTYLAFGFIVIAVYRFYLTQILEMRWRAWMTDHYLKRWLSQHAFYLLELRRYAQGGSPDNPDQRIQEDLNLFTAYTVSLSMGLLNAVVTLVSFVGILWSLSGNFAFTLGGTEWDIPGFMVWMAVLYCVVGSVLTHYIGRPLVALNFEQQRREADFRHHLVRVREYSESIALDRGEAVEGAHSRLRFAAVLKNYLLLLQAQKRLTWFTVGFGQAAVVFPFIIAAPRFFSGAIQLGQLMQIASAFGRVQDSLSWFVDNYDTLARWRATTDRLSSFDAAMRAHEAESAPSALQSSSTTSADQALDLRGLAVSLPDGRLLLQADALTLKEGERVLLQGPSGSGKSSLFRLVAGIWPFAEGSLARSPDFLERAMFLPQRPYLPNGPLREALAYPEPVERFDDAALVHALQQAQLPHLAQQLDVSDAWGQKLSGGEQQRLAAARVFLKQPRWLFLDEATSALDEATEAALYQQFAEVVLTQQGALVSIAHRPGVAAWHSGRWQVEPGAAGLPAQLRAA
jgi:putative ATP-binding cassette transporter